ncbi:hypothetical protein GW796_06440 [archaeon]|nr:hypothetical protein [archaeon]
MNVNNISQAEFNKEFYNACQLADAKKAETFYISKKSIQFLNFTFKKNELSLDFQGDQLTYACRFLQHNIIDLICSQNITELKLSNEILNKSLNIGFFDALVSGKTDTCDYILKYKKLHPDFPDKEFLALADTWFIELCYDGNLKSIQYLLENDTIKNLEPFLDAVAGRAFSTACAENKLDVIEYLTKSPTIHSHINLNSIKQTL